MALELLHQKMLNSIKKEVIEFDELMQNYKQNIYNNSLESLEQKMLDLSELNMKLVILESYLLNIRCQLISSYHDETYNFRIQSKQAAEEIKVEIDIYKSMLFSITESLRTLTAYVKIKNKNFDYK